MLTVPAGAASMRAMGMLIVFETYLAHGTTADNVLSEEVKKDTMAQVMTDAEAEAVGFHGIQPDPQGRARCFIAVAERDRRFIQSRLESSRGVVGFQVHEVVTDD